MFKHQVLPLLSDRISISWISLHPIYSSFPHHMQTLLQLGDSIILIIDQKYIFIMENKITYSYFRIWQIFVGAYYYLASIIQE